MMRLIRYSLYCLMLTALLWQCRTAPGNVGAVKFDPAAAPYPKLSDYAFFQALSPNGAVPNAGVLPYEPITPLFTDYAHKARYVWMPDSVQATVDADGRILFPDHTVLIKTFYYPADFARPEQDWDLIETRLLMKRDGEWDAYTYIWNDKDTEAELNLVGDFKPVSWADEQGLARTVEYAVPNKNQCKSCHNQNKKLLPIGPKVRNLNAALTYPDGTTANQLERWQSAGKLTAGDWAAQFTPLADWDDPKTGNIADRALAYLEVNCGHCHHPEGPAHTTGLYLGTDFQGYAAQLGICKSPVAAGKGSGGRQFGIQPGQPDSSILLYRMEADDPGVMMPEIGRAVPHKEGIALVREWIKGLEGDCGK
ncbi:SO2930 family diheme c-type cytochrome [Phaeodactylibacter xiamenensis]|uniref:SO2930 family diheme c-type cytochrome n=1 Tax=Phaeodactylibacter xiamenensis TaxID=1524460 RepID=UPI003BAC6CCC